MYKHLQISHTRHSLTQALVCDSPHYSALITLPDIMLAHDSQRCPNARHGFGGISCQGPEDKISGWNETYDKEKI